MPEPQRIKRAGDPGPAGVMQAAALDGHDDLMKDVLERLPQGVVMFDANGKVQFANRRYSEIYGLPPEHVVPGITLEELFRLRSGSATLEPKADHLCRRLREAVAAGEVITVNFTTDDGRNIHCINTPLQSGGWLVTHEDVTQQHQAEKQIAHMASHDALTDLPNRNSFKDQLDHALRFNAEGKLVAVMFIDLDNFKAINDTLGHQIGDELLKAVAERLRSCMCETDTVARFGGDEFVVISWALDKPSDAALLASRIRDSILEPYDLRDHHVVVDASIGIALSPNDGTDAGQLLKNADLALYSAKGSGRGTYHFFENDMDVRMMARRDLELDLRAALVNGEFELHYQPLIDLEKDTISCCEALLRWKHPRRGMVLPGTFVGLAEEIGLIDRIGEWVIRTACAEASSWPGEVTVAVNVSPIQFRNNNLVQIVTHALASSGLAPERLEIEITEAVMLERTEETLSVLKQLHSLGVRITMDDFGTGYSSLSYLQKFPFDKIKIDQAFIANLPNEGESIAIVRAVTGIAGSFRMKTTAEGVETERQRAIVASLGCTEMQGNLFSAARPAAEIAEFLSSHKSGRQAA
ncbi:MAG: EAL domain-containing protein [Novosphingobium sp.]|nr:EAL domain-containing protein [Novosphingobium sp.]MCP5404260.1 EAL domain-containing protein [Novosphingobium sp.]